MNDKKTWWQVLPIGKKGSIFVGVIVFALVIFLAWKAFWTPNNRDSLALQQQEEKIRDMEDRIARLQKELEESSKQIASLQAGSDETTRARRSAQRNVNNSRREETRLADQNPSPEPRFYQTVRSTSVFEGFCGERNHASSPCSWRYTHSPSVSGLLFSSHALNIGDS